MTTQELKDLRDKLPSGSISKIAEKSGIKYFNVSRFFNGNVLKTEQSTKILNATADYLEEIKKREKEATERVKAVISTDLQPA